jgi:hypothetical protein
VVSIVCEGPLRSMETLSVTTLKPSVRHLEMEEP